MSLSSKVVPHLQNGRSRESKRAHISSAPAFNRKGNGTSTQECVCDWKLSSHVSSFFLCWKKHIQWPSQAKAARHGSTSDHKRWVILLYGKLVQQHRSSVIAARPHLCTAYKEGCSVWSRPLWILFILSAVYTEVTGEVNPQLFTTRSMNSFEVIIDFTVLGLHILVVCPIIVLLQ